MGEKTFLDRHPHWVGLLGSVLCYGISFCVMYFVFEMVLFSSLGMSIFGALGVGLFGYIAKLIFWGDEGMVVSTRQRVTRFIISFVVWVVFSGVLILFDIAILKAVFIPLVVAVIGVAFFGLCAASAAGKDSSGEVDPMDYVG